MYPSGDSLRATAAPMEGVKSLKRNQPGPLLGGKMGGGIGSSPYVGVAFPKHWQVTETEVNTLFPSSNATHSPPFAKPLSAA